MTLQATMLLWLGMLNVTKQNDTLVYNKQVVKRGTAAQNAKPVISPPVKKLCLSS